MQQSCVTFIILVFKNEYFLLLVCLIGVRPSHYKWIEYQKVGYHSRFNSNQTQLSFLYLIKIKRTKVVSSFTENFKSPSLSSRDSKIETGPAVEVEPIKSRTKMLNFDYFSNTRKRKNIWILEKANLNFDFFPSLLFATELFKFCWNKKKKKTIFQCCGYAREIFWRAIEILDSRKKKKKKRERVVHPSFLPVFLPSDETNLWVPIENNWREGLTAHNLKLISNKKKIQFTVCFGDDWELQTIRTIKNLLKSFRYPFLLKFVLTFLLYSCSVD